MHKKSIAVLMIVAMVAITLPFIMDDQSGTDGDSSPEASISSTYYATIEEAITASQSGDTIRVLTNCTIDSDVVIPAGVTLLIPYSATDMDGHELGSKNLDSNGYPIYPYGKIPSEEEYRYLTVTITSGKNIDVYGTIIVGGITGRFFTFDYQGHTSNSFSKITLNGTITLENGSIMQCYGFIKGSGTLNALEGSKVYEPFLITDFVGGDNAYNQYKSGQSPFNRYSFMNVQCKMVLKEGSHLYGYVNIFAKDQNNVPRYNETTVSIVDTSSALFILNNDSTITFTYNSQKYVKAEWESNIWNDIGKTTITIDGGATMGSIIMTAAGNSMDTKDCIFSLPYNIDIVMKNGNYNLKYQYRILPGSSMTISNDATLNIIGGLHVYDGLNDVEFRDKYYPTSSQLESFSFSTCGKLILNGTLNIRSGATLAGTVESKNVGAQIIVNSSANVNSINVKYGCNYKAQGVSNKSTNETTRILSATVFNTSGIEIPLVAGNTYTCMNTNTSTNATYTSTNTQTKTDSTITVNQTIYGQWKKVVQQHSVTYDVNGGSESAPIQSAVYEEDTFTIASYAGTKDGYDFEGWSDGSNIYEAGSTYTMGASNITLTAVWESNAITHTVTYRTNGGSASAPVQSSVAEGKTFTIKSYAGTKDGYLFSGWSDGSDIFTAGSKYTMGTSNVILTAVWEKAIIYHKVTYDANGGSEPSPAEISVVEGGKFTISSYSGTKEGYSFSGWSDGNNTYRPGNTYTLGSSDVKLTAVWIPGDTFKIVSETNDGGTISPSGNIFVTTDSTQSYIILANNGYVVKDVLVDGNSIGAVNKYTFTNINSNHTITVTFDASNGATTWIDPSTGYIYEETRSITRDTQTVITKMTSTSGDVLLRAVITNDELNIVTIATTNGDIETRISITASLDGPVDASSISDEQLAEILSQISEAYKDFASSDIVITINILGSDNNATSTKVTLSMDIFDTLSNIDKSLIIETDTGTLNMCEDTIKTLSSYEGDLALTIGIADKGGLTQEQQDKIGDKTVISISVAMGSTSIHDLGGNATVTMPYTLKSGEDPNKIEIWYLDDQGNITEIGAIYDSETKTVSFVTDHFSCFAIAFDEPVTSEGSSDIWIYIGIAIAIVILIIIAIYIKTR